MTKNNKKKNQIILFRSFFLLFLFFLSSSMATNFWEEIFLFSQRYKTNKINHKTKKTAKAKKSIQIFKHAIKQLTKTDSKEEFLSR